MKSPVMASGFFLALVTGHARSVAYYLKPARICWNVNPCP